MAYFKHALFPVLADEYGTATLDTMNYLLRLTVLGLACAFAPVCFGQWMWVDKDGRKVFSDRMPPPEVPADKVLKRPAGARAAESDAAAAAPAQAASASANAPKPSGKDKELEEKRKQAQAAEAEKKKAQEEQIAKARAENCDRAKRAKATLDSGVRLAQVNSKGEREIMEDAQRAAESKRLEAIIASDCRAAQ